LRLGRERVAHQDQPRDAGFESAAGGVEERAGGRVVALVVLVALAENRADEVEGHRARRRPASPRNPGARGAESEDVLLGRAVFRTDDFNC
jgi:hypothetical protein